jgi:hypothetical protein
MVGLDNSALKVASPLVRNSSRVRVPAERERCYAFCECHSNRADFTDWTVIRHIYFAELRKLNNRLQFV